MNAIHSHYRRSGEHGSNRRRPLIKESTKYHFAAGFSIGALLGILATFTIALFR